VLEFAQPVSLSLLLLVPFVLWQQIRPRGESLRFANVRTLETMPAGRRIRVRWGVAIGRSIVLVLLIIAAAGPRIPDRKTLLPTESVAIMLVLDTSGSMMAENQFDWDAGTPKISRAEAARRAFRLFVAGGKAPDGTQFNGRSTERGTDAIGLITFELWPQPVCPPTLNHKVLLHILEHTRPGTEEGSNIGDALVEGLQRLKDAKPARKVLILLSDGELEYPIYTDAAKPLRPGQAAKLAKKVGIPIYVIDTGGDLPPDAAPATIERRREAEAINQNIVGETNGRLFKANDGKQLLEVCKTIDSLERQPILSHSYRRFHELASWFAAAALALLTLLVALDLTLWRRLP